MGPGNREGVIFPGCKTPWLGDRILVWTLPGIPDVAFTTHLPLRASITENSKYTHMHRDSWLHIYIHSHINGSENNKGTKQHNLNFSYSSRTLE